MAKNKSSGICVGLSDAYDEWLRFDVFIESVLFEIEDHTNIQINNKSSGKP